MNEPDGVQLRDLWRALRRRRRLVLVTAGAVVALAFATTLYRRITSPVYSGDFQLLISDPISSDSAGSPSGEAGGGGVVENLARNRTSADIPTLIQALSSPLVLNPVRRQLGSHPEVLNTLNITQPGDGRRGGQVSGVLVVTLKGEVPGQVQRSLEALSQTYLNFSLSQRRERLIEGLRFLNKQEPVLEGKVNHLQGQLADFRRRHNLLAPGEQALALKTEVIGMQAQQRQLLADRARLLRLRQDIASGRLTASNFTTGSSGSGSGSGGAGSADGVSVTQARSDLLDQLQSVEQQLAQARAIYRTNTPRVQNLVALRNRLSSQRRGQQLEAVDTALNLNATRTTILNNQTQDLNQQFGSQPSLIKEFEELQARLKVAQDNLASLLSTRSTFQLEQAQNTTPWKVISPPRVASAPEEPSLQRGLLQALLLGAAAGIAAGLLRDRLDHVFHNPSEVKDEFQEPLLGHIPHVAFFKGVREDNRFLIDELERSGTENNIENRLSGYQRFFYQEAFRNLFTSLRFLNSGQPLRSVALTSSLPAEGKSLINVLLAKTISEMGQRVLLVDADLRKPQMHHRLGVNNLTGLSNLLTEDDLHWQQVIQPVANHESWSVLTAGRRPPDPARLLSSSRMHTLVRQLADSGQFDLILYDTPPVLGLADAALVAEHLDGIILLISLSRVDRSLPRESIARIRSSGAALLGMVTNAVKEENESSSGYGYGYGYGYGRYGYGYGAYDPRTTYSYYQDDTAQQTEQAPLPVKGRLQHWRESLLRWIDS